MAVIRQQTQVFNKPVGVRRINTGEAELWEQVAASADEFRRRAFEKAALEAKQAGAMKGMSVASGEIAAIDPETNQPVAFKAPANTGSIYSSAYQDVITRRFEESVNTELKAQGSYYAKNATSADEYKIAISGHVGNMIKAGGDDTYFSRYIEETGQAYVDSTYVAMKAKETEAIIFQTNTNDYLAGLESEHTIRLNIQANNLNDVAKGLDAEEKRARNLFDTKYLTLAQYEAKKNIYRGLRSLSNNVKLTNVYTSMSKDEKTAFISSLDNPSEITNPVVKTMVINALVGANKNTLIEGFKAIDTRAEDVVVSVVDAETSALINQINKNMDYNEIQELTSSIENREIRKQVFNNLSKDHLNKSLDFYAQNSNAASALINELRSAEPNGVNLTKIIQEAYNNNNPDAQDVPDIVQFIQDMEPEDRVSYAESLSARLPSIKALETQSENEWEINARGKIRNIETLIDYQRIKKSILDNKKLVNQDKLLGVAAEKFADVMSNQAKSIAISHEEMSNVRNAINDKSFASSLTITEKAAYDYYKKAHDITPSSVNATMSNRLDAIVKVNENLGHEVKIKAIKGSLEKGINVDAQELEYLQKEIMGEEIFLTAENIENYPIMTDALKKGIMFPAIKSFFNSAVTSTNEATVAKAGNLFEEMSRVKVNSEGMSYQIDMLKVNMKPETYAQLNAATVIARAEYTTPFLVISELRQYDGNLDEDVLADYNNSTAGNLKKIKSIFDDRNVSPNFRKELSIAIKMQKARGVQITEEAVDTIVENYIETNNMGRDTNVISPHIDGATAYPVLSFINEVNFTQNRIALTKAIAQDDAYSPLLKGGTKLDQARELAKDLTLQNLPTMLRGIVESFKGQYQARSELADVNLTKEGHKVLNTDLFWKPDLMSFANGVPKYTAQYKDVNNTFQDLIVNGEPWALERIGDYRDEFRSVAHKEFIAKLKSTKPKIKAEGYINYQATLKHMTFAEFKKDPEFNELVAAYGNEEEVKIAYATQRLRWNAQSNNAFREQLMNIDIKDAALQYLRGVEGIGQK